jgi:hypothetical protein
VAEFRESIKPAAWGVAIGVAATVAIGFAGFDWTLASTAEHMAATRAEQAVVGVLTPICVDRFRQDADFKTMLAKLKDAPVWNRYQVVEENGWANIPGTDKSHSAVARACAEKIGETA